jgi:hypothetical protein
LAKTLAATALREFWGPEPLALGLWCKPDAGTPFAPEPFADAHEIELAARAVDAEIEKALGALAPALSALHGLERPREYWHRLIGPWLMRAAHLSHDHWARLDAAFAAHGDLKAFVLDAADAVVVADTAHFLKLSLSDGYNQQVFGELMRDRGFPARRFAAKPDFSVPPPPVRTSRLLDRAVRAAAPSLIVTELLPDRKDQYALYAASAGRAAPFVAPLPPLPREIRRADRQALRKTIGGALGMIVENAFPAVYLEGFAAARAAVLKGWRKRPKAMASSTGWLFNEALKIAGAEFALEGTRLVGCQHGGSYGFHKELPTERLERSLVDRFVTWGWEGKDAVAAAPPRLRRYAKAGRARGAKAGRLLYVGNNLPLYPYQLSNLPFGRELEKYQGDQERFIEALTGEARKALVARPYPLKFGLDPEARLRARYPDLAFEKGVPMSESFARARLVVMDCLTTSFLEAMAFDVPTILFSAPRWSAHRPEAAAEAEALRFAGILHDTPEAAAAQANAVYADPAAWWDTPACKKARDLWRSKQARCAGGALWTRDWLKLLAA